MDVTVNVSAAAPLPISARTLGVNYWLWAPTWDNNVAGTEDAVLALGPGVLRVGGHNNDNNTPDPFDDAELDRAVAYARSVGAEPLLQVPLLAAPGGAPATAETAAHMVTYANVTQSYGVKFFSIGNEPDLYPDAEATLPNFSAADYCAHATEFAQAMRAADPAIRIVGPDLSWKYRSGSQDWLTPILQQCGAVFDVVAVHRYPFAPEQALTPGAARDAAAFRSDIDALRALMKRAGYESLPLAITETNITYNGDPKLPVLSASPGTMPAALWAADALGVAVEKGLWSLTYWSISEGWSLGLLDTQHNPRHAYRALRLFAAHQGSALLAVNASSDALHAYATRDDDGTNHVNLVNWSASDVRVSVRVDGIAGAAPQAKFLLPALSVSAVDVADAGTASGLVYSESVHSAEDEPVVLAPLTE